MNADSLRAGGGHARSDGEMNVLTFRFPDSALGALDAVEGTAVGQTSSWSEFLEQALEAAEQGRPLMLLAPETSTQSGEMNGQSRLDRMAVLLVKQVLRQVREASGLRNGGSEPAVHRAKPNGAANGTSGQSDRGTVLEQLLGQADLRRRLQPDLSPYDESWDFMVALAQGGLQGRTPSVSGLCRQVGCPLATGQRRVERLEELGLIRRSQDPDNLRRHRVELSDRGRSLIDAYIDGLAEGAIPAKSVA